ncbi:hypothetical protein ACFY12_03525 [Streptomyces sp. NPDC001339]|uniref:hypothetical protein n=1 Tax=Streptomyces sp. NPDC001339 TaxID=3364563 RepID=UPI0036CF1D9A
MGLVLSMVKAQGIAMLKGFEDWRVAATAAVLVAGGVWGVSRALSTRDAQIDRLIGVLDKAVAGDAVREGLLQEARRR